MGILRIVLGVVGGLVVGFAVLWGAQMLGHMIWPLPAGIDTHDLEQIKNLRELMPLPAVAWVLLGWALSMFAGAATGLAIAQGRRFVGWIVIAAFFVLCVWTMMTVNHPVWFMVGSVVVTLAAGYAAQRWQGKKAG